MIGVNHFYTFSYPEGQQPSDKTDRVYGKCGTRRVVLMLGIWSVIYERILP